MGALRVQDVWMRPQSLHFGLSYKRLEAGMFRVETRDGYEQLTGVDLKYLLDGTELSRIKLRREVEKGVYS